MLSNSVLQVTVAVGALPVPRVSWPQHQYSKSLHPQLPQEAVPAVYTAVAVTTLLKSLKMDRGHRIDRETEPFPGRLKNLSGE